MDKTTIGDRMKNNYENITRYYLTRRMPVIIRVDGQALFCEIVDYKEIEDSDKFVVLSHYPIPCFNRHYYGAIHLYGHVHNSFEWNMMQHIKLEMKELYDKPCNMYNVGCMVPYMNFTPGTLEEIIDWGDAYDHHLQV